jgi:quinoprotein glucose dehydrogenase
MSRSPDHPRPDPRRLARLIGLAVVVINGLVAPPTIRAEGREGLVELGRLDGRLKGYFAPKGFKVQVVATDPAIADPVAMAFDDSGDLFVVEWRRADRTFETRDTLALPEGGTTRIHRVRKGTTDVVKRLRDLDGDGVYESAEVVLEGAEMPSAILPLKGGLLLACVGRLERWSDEDNDGRFETRAVLADGFPATGRQSLDGLTLGPDGWLYLTAGDGESHVVGSDGSRVDLSRTGGVYRCRPDGSRVRLLSRGFRGPSHGLAFDGSFDPFVLDDDPADGSKFQGVRLIRPFEDGDHGWRLQPGGPGSLADFDLGAADGERPGKLGAVARLGRGAPSGLVIYQGSALPEPLRGAIVYPDLVRRAVRGLKVEPRGASHLLKGEMTLLASDDERFRPIRVAVGADGAIYVLDHRSSTDGPAGRVLRLTWEGDGVTPVQPARPNHWKRILAASNEQLVSQFLASPDRLEADRAQRELIDRDAAARALCVGQAGKVGAPLYARLLGVQGARQFWNEEVESAMIGLLDDHEPDVRRLAAQSLAWEPRTVNPVLVPKLLAHLNDPDGRVLREVVLAIGRHAEPNARKPASLLVRWLYAHPETEAAVKDAFLRALERMGEAGVEEVALAIRTRPGADRETAVSLFSAFRSPSAAEQLISLIKIPDLSAIERLTLIRKFPDFPAEVAVPTQPLVDWLARHSETDSASKLAGLDACRLAGNPASKMVLALLEDEDETVRLAATRLAGRTRPPGSMTRLVERLKDPDGSPAERRTIVRSLSSAGPPAFATIDSVYLDSEDPALRKLALRSMAEADRSKAIPALEAALTGPDPGIRLEAIRIMGESPGSALILGKAYRNKALNRGDLPAVLAALRKHETAEIRKLLASIEEEATRSTAATDPSEIRDRLARGADPWAGLGVFFRPSPARCASCHSVEGRGGTGGPALTLGKQSLTADRLIDAIIRHPGKKPGAEATRPRDNRASAGPGVDPALTLTAASDESSLRPERASIELTPFEVADLAAFLLSKPAQESLKHGASRLDRALAIGPFAPGADRLRIPLDKVDPAKHLPGQDGLATSWMALEADGSGTFCLRGEFGSMPGRAYLAVRVRSAREQSAALRFGVEGAARVYLDGAKVAEIAGSDPSKSFPTRLPTKSGEPAPLPDLARLPLKAGWNLLVVALDRDGTGNARVALEIASPEPLEIGFPKN